MLHAHIYLIRVLSVSLHAAQELAVMLRGVPSRRVRVQEKLGGFRLWLAELTKDSEYIDIGSVIHR